MKKYIVPILFAALALLLVLGGCDFLPGPPGYSDMNNPLDKYDPNDSTSPGTVSALNAAWNGNTDVLLTWTPPPDADYAGVEVTWSPPTNENQPRPVGSNQNPNTSFVGFNPNTVYVFTVSTFDFNENAGGIATFTLNPMANTVLPVDNLSATYDGVAKIITVNWNNPSDYVAGATTISISTNPGTAIGTITVSDGSTQAIIPVSQFGISYTVIASVRRNSATSVDVTTVVNVPADDPLRVGLVGEWLFENGSLQDTSGSNYNASLTGTANFDADRFSSTASPNASAMYVYTATPATPSYVAAGAGALPTGGGSRTLSAWVKLSEYPISDGVVLKYGDVELVVGGIGYLGTIANGTRVDCTDPSTRLFLNTWYHLVLIYDAGTLTIVVNSQNAGSWVASLNTSSAGGLTMGANIRGWIDDVRIYSRVLQPSEVGQLHRMKGYYDLASDFSTVANPSGPWAFGQFMAFGGYTLAQYVMMDAPPPAGATAANWYVGGDANSASVWMNRGGLPIFGVGAGSVALRPTNTMAPARGAVLRFIAPDTGIHTYSFNIRITPSIAADTHASMYVNGVMNSADDFGTLWAAFDASITKSLNGGDYVDIVITATATAADLDTPVAVTVTRTD